LNAGVRVTTGSMVAFGIVIAAALLAAVALFVRPLPPSLRPPASRPAGSNAFAAPEAAAPLSAPVMLCHDLLDLIPQQSLSFAEEAHADVDAPEG